MNHQDGDLGDRAGAGHAEADRRCGCCSGSHQHGRARHQGEDTMGGLVRGLFGSNGGAIGVGAAIASGLMLLAANRDKLKPMVVGTLKEYYRFSDWATTGVAQVKEDLSDMAADARHQYEQEVQVRLELLEKERRVVQRLADLARKRREET